MQERLLDAKEGQSDRKSNQSSSRFTIWYYDTPRKRGITQREYIDHLHKSHTFDSIASFQRCWDSVLLEILPLLSSMLIFREGIRPLWEDPGNRNGGKFAFSLTISHERTLELYVNIVQTLLRRELGFDDDVCGVVISLRPWGGTVSVWNRDAKNASGIKNLRKQLSSMFANEINGVILYQPHRQSIHDNRKQVFVKNKARYSRSAEELSSKRSTQEQISEGKNSESRVPLYSRGVYSKIDRVISQGIAEATPIPQQTEKNISSDESGSEGEEDGGEEQAKEEIHVRVEQAKNVDRKEQVIEIKTEEKSTDSAKEQRTEVVSPAAQPFVETEIVKMETETKSALSEVALATVRHNNGEPQPPKSVGLSSRVSNKRRGGGYLQCTLLGDSLQHPFLLLCVLLLFLNQIPFMLEM